MESPEPMRNNLVMRMRKRNPGRNAGLTHQTSTAHLDASVGSLYIYIVCQFIEVTPRVNSLRKADPSL